MQQPPAVFSGGHGWGDNNAGWAESGRSGGWVHPVGFAWDGGRRNFGSMNTGWTGPAVGVGMRGKASYNAVGPPPSIAYEHQKVMAEESVALPVSSGGFGDAARESLDDSMDDTRDRRRSFREESGGREPGRERRSFREEGGERSPNAGETQGRRSFREEASAESPRRSFREAEPQTVEPTASEGRGADEAQERSDRAQRKRRFVEFAADEPSSSRSTAAGENAAATGARGEKAIQDCACQYVWLHKLLPSKVCQCMLFVCEYHESMHFSYHHIASFDAMRLA